jgi:hypothetical protein
MRKHFENEAIEALRETLKQISAIKVKEIRQETAENSREKTILGRIDIYGHEHLLECKLSLDCEASHVKRALRKLHGLKMHPGGAKIPVLITPAMSDEAQNMCRESGVGFLDLKGNASLYLDEVFIVKRSLPQHTKLPSAAESLPTSETAHYTHLS